MNISIDILNLQENLHQQLELYRGCTILIKYGGNAMTDDKLKTGFAQDIVALKQLGIRPIIVHGGGPQINYWLERLGKKGEFIQGMRVTDHETMSVVEMVLSGLVGKEISALINKNGGNAISISGRDSNLIQAKKLFVYDKNAKKIDLGQVAEVAHINTMVIKHLLDCDIIPVIAPIGIGENAEAFNINADLVAGEIAQALGVKRLLLLTNIPGVLDKAGVLISNLNAKKIKDLIDDNTIYGGMLPKVQSALYAAQNGVGAVQILDGRIPHVLLKAFTEKLIVGSLISAT